MVVPQLFGKYAPDYNADAYSPKDALSFALASHLSYKNATATDEVLPSWGFGNNEFIEAKRGRDIDTQGFIGANSNNMLVAFRGSEPIVEDWLSNIQFVTDPGPFKNSKVHEGFQDALFPVLMQLTYALKQFEKTNQKIWVTGHSLGGALASLFAAMVLERGLPLTGVYTYAAPRVGDKTFEKAMDTHVRNAGALNWRIVNEGDLVPHLPPEPWFSHAGTRVLLQMDDTTTTDLDTWVKFKHDISDWFSKFKKKIKVADVHRLNTNLGYIPRLEKQLK